MVKECSYCDECEACFGLMPLPRGRCNTTTGSLAKTMAPPASMPRDPLVTVAAGHQSPVKRNHGIAVEILEQVRVISVPTALSTRCRLRQVKLHTAAMVIREFVKNGVRGDAASPFLSLNLRRVGVGLKPANVAKLLRRLRSAAFADDNERRPEGGMGVLRVVFAVDHIKHCLAKRPRFS
jgi:hypothetical protein